MRNGSVYFESNLKKKSPQLRVKLCNFVKNELCSKNTRNRVNTAARDVTVFVMTSAETGLLMQAMAAAE